MKKVCIYRYGDVSARGCLFKIFARSIQCQPFVTVSGKAQGSLQDSKHCNFSGARQAAILFCPKREHKMLMRKENVYYYYTATINNR